MKRLVFLTMLQLVVLSSKSQMIIDKVTIGWKQYNLHTKVKSLHQISYSADEKYGEVVRGTRMIEDDIDVTFDEQGNIIKQQTGLDNAVNYVYNDNGQIQESSSSDGRKTIYKCDSGGFVIEATNYNSNGGRETHTKFTYNTTGNIIESSNNRNGTVIIKKYKYDTKGNEIQVTVSGAMAVVTNRKYDDKGNIVEETSQVIGREVKSVYKYTFDVRGNWITQTVYKSTALIEPQAKRITERTIEYY